VYKHLGGNLKPIRWDMDLDIDTLIEIIMLKATATATFTNWPAQLTGQDNTQEDENVFEFNSFNE
jgi:hypothetical protein